MAPVRFKLPIGNKRQVTIPKQCMDLLSLEEGGELLLEVVGDHAILLPVVSVPRRDLPEDIRKKFESRRGRKTSDIPLSEFLAEMGNIDDAQMDAVLDGPRTERSDYAPRIETVMIPIDKIRDLIGEGGATIRGIFEQTGAKIDVDDTGRVSVASSDAEGLKKALEIIGNITAVPEIGKVYMGKVVRLAEFGAFVELFPGTDGLLHISEIADHRVKDIREELREGDQVMVKVLAIEGNRIKLSRKALIKEQKAKHAEAARVELEAGSIEA
jgi:predicted RNA-binding protein with RPS1 domain/bifunctional DNA-binding transcriptional regulator/antitoxin component of YhaV-PrlF toxin-antitoxin module